jgi:hypothetical protein
LVSILVAAVPCALILFVVGDYRLEQVLKSLVSARVVSAGDLKQQALERVQTSQRMPRDGVRQPGAQHYELMLPLGFGRPHGSSHCVIEAPELALGATVHIAHANHYGMRLIVQVQAIGNQLL